MSMPCFRMAMDNRGVKSQVCVSQKSFGWIYKLWYLFMCSRLSVCVSLLFMLTVFSCSNETESVSTNEISENNVFKEYDNAVNKAKELEHVIQDAAKQRTKEVDRQGD